MFIHRSVKANADFSSAEIGSFLETNSFRRNASGSGFFFFLKRAEPKEYRRTLFCLKSLFLICTMVTALLQNYNCKIVT